MTHRIIDNQTTEKLAHYLAEQLQPDSLISLILKSLSLSGFALQIFVQSRLTMFRAMRLHLYGSEFELFPHTFYCLAKPQSICNSVNKKFIITCNNTPPATHKNSALRGVFCFWGREND
jgi:hypothetical protein